MSNEAGKPDYTQYVEYMENMGWRRSQVVLNEKNARIVTVSSSAVATTTAVIDIRCPAGQKISIKGVEQIPRGSDARSAHALRLRLAGTSDAEISPYTTLRITKEKTTEDAVQLARIFYIDAALIMQTGTNPRLKTDLEWYRFSQGIELNGEEHMFIYVVAETPTGGPNLPDVAIDSTHVKFALNCDMWTS